MERSTQDIWNNFSDELRRYILRKVKEKTVADDLLQEVFVKILTKLDQVKQAKNLQQYLYVIARNTVIDHLKSNQPKLSTPALPLIEEQDLQLNTTIAECCIKPFIQKLPEKYREALIATAFEGISQKDLAARLNISYSGAKSRVQRGKEKLKELIRSCCTITADRYGNIQSAKVSSCKC